MTNITKTIYQYIFNKFNWLFLAFVLLGFLPSHNLLAQNDTEFWFVAPEITLGHFHPGGANAFLKMSSGNLPAKVTISMPAADPLVFPDIVIDMLPNSFHVEDLTCWVVSPCTGINPGSTYPVASYYDVNLLENKPLNPNGINNFGLKITSTTPITAYYEISRHQNKDIWALKGSNGLGTEFYTPFQNIANNGSYTPQPYSAIDVVASVDGTVVQFRLPPGIAASYGAGPQTNIPQGGIFTRTLQRGQTFSLFPLDFSQVAANRLAGTKITSNNPIAVTLKDDSHAHLSYGCRDVSGDQLIPTNIIGKEYIAIRTALYDQDNLFILATEKGTTIKVFNDAGNIVNTQVLNASQQFHQPLPDGQTYYRIVADKPVYVWHVGGFGCEVGGAVLPPIDKCTGVPRVSFARTSSEEFFIIMMVRQGAEKSFTFDGAVNNVLFPPSNFTPVQDSEWSVARFGPFSTAQIAVGTHYMENSEDIFHLGIVNGGAGSGCFYGYFSDYSEFAPTTLVVETGTSGGRICVGETLQLMASGGTKYKWVPNLYLDFDDIATPLAQNILTSITYEVQVSGACNLADTIAIAIQAAGPVDVDFEPDTYEGCAKPPAGGGTPVYNFTFMNQSTGDYS
ncbi:MAG: IgGFc-binding protein, partial [Bacteroidales bacterium]|nr:IgGFc-binding protein [Bacteroidales bacterium]